MLRKAVAYAFLQFKSLLICIIPIKFATYVLEYIAFSHIFSQMLK